MKHYARRFYPDTTHIEANLDRSMLRTVCQTPADIFGEVLSVETDYAIHKYAVDQPVHDFYYFADNGADILFVAHLDTVESDTSANIMDTADGPVIFSGALDDRLGAWVGLDLLPRLGCHFDYLFTTGEESGASTAAYFDPSAHHDRGYNWIIEFDRGGTDVVMYQFEDDATRALVEATGAVVEPGIFSDISFLEHVGVKAFNWGVGYRDYHGPRSHAWLRDTFRMVAYFLDFYESHADTHLPHEPESSGGWWSGYRGMGARASTDDWWDSEPERDLGATDCSEYDERYAEECTEDVYTTAYGVLCAEHRSLYFG